MATKKQRAAAKKNVRKAREAWKAMSPRARTIAQPQGRGRKKPGTGSAAKFYRIEIRPKGAFTSFRTQDVGKKGGLERIAGHRKSGSWATATWLVAKDKAHVSKAGELILDDAKERASLMKAIRGKITEVRPGIFHAHPARNIPERKKPTPAMRQAQAKNLRKARRARRA